MKRIGLLSDTHSYWDDKYEKYFSECDEIWHAGDIGSMEVAEKLRAIKPLRAYTEIVTEEICAICFPSATDLIVRGWMY